MTFINDTSRSPRAQVRPLALEKLKLNGFMGRYEKLMKSTTLIAQYEFLESTGRLNDLKATVSKAAFNGAPSNLCDVCSWIEAVSYALIDNEDPELREKLQAVVSEIKNAMSETGKELSKEVLACAGSLIQAAVTHRRVTGSEVLFNVATQLAERFVDSGNGHGTVVEHPQLVTALVELYRESDRRSFLDLALRLIETSGDDTNDEISRTFKGLQVLSGNAVRMLTLCAGAADIFLETGDEFLLATLDRLWKDLVAKKMYITGGVGSRHEGEAFGEAYELPNHNPCARTDAALANVFWNWRMYMISGEGKYLDVLERALYNGVLPGISLDGLRYFCVNPLEDNGNSDRKDWCDCIATYIARVLTSFKGYMYGLALNEIRVNLYEESETVVPFRDGEVSIIQKTSYPHDGKVELIISTGLEVEFSIMLRIPGWTHGEFDLQIDGIKQKLKAEKGFIRLTNSWKGSTSVLLNLPMYINMVTSNPLLRGNTDKVAIQHGPLVYCAEGIDNEDSNVRTLAVPLKRGYDTSLNEELPGVLNITGKGMSFDLDDWENTLYSPLGSVKSRVRNVKFTLIPYYAWNNRGNWPMCVWLHLH